MAIRIKKYYVYHQLAVTSLKFVALDLRGTRMHHDGN